MAPGSRHFHSQCGHKSCARCQGCQRGQRNLQWQQKPAKGNKHFLAGKEIKKMSSKWGNKIKEK